NHTATHLLHGALRRILGQHVQQKGSYVNPERLRFDFSHFSKMTDNEIALVEASVNEEIRRAEEVQKHADIPYDDAIAKGALAFFGDKYADLVRVVEVPGISVELCGGTHVDNIGRIGLFKIVSESSVASGVRRIEALTGKSAEKLLWQEYRSWRTCCSSLLQSLLVELQSASEVSGCRVLTKVVEGTDGDALRSAGLALREQQPCAVGLLSCVQDGKVSLVGFASDKAVKELGIDAGKLVREAAQHVQGGGGGKPEFATAGGKNPDGVDKALEAFKDAVKTALKG
ncbi:MAG: alanine--tRNA ligase, partial [Chlorobiaceae bacterium]|nr:alanine--tRNA ligase [Chlorobiaceae bacterium]